VQGLLGRTEKSLDAGFMIRPQRGRLVGMAVTWGTVINSITALIHHREGPQPPSLRLRELDFYVGPDLISKLVNPILGSHPIKVFMTSPRNASSLKPLTDDLQTPRRMQNLSQLRIVALKVPVAERSQRRWTVLEISDLSWTSPSPSRIVVALARAVPARHLPGPTPT